MAQRICRWCGKEYNFLKTPSIRPDLYCSKRCETAAENEKSQRSSYSSSSVSGSGGGCAKWIIRFIVLIFFIFFIIGYCSEKNQRKVEKEKTENVREANE